MVDHYCLVFHKGVVLVIVVGYIVNHLCLVFKQNNFQFMDMSTSFKIRTVFSLIKVVGLIVTFFFSVMLQLNII
jgi:hypothetical protein